ncbi:MAG: FtsQ-type POTRA domain-containing protein [Tissierella sp.]|nr:FtsQ-type POTRA domain-containing protein [Tissierella sp.]
MQKPTKIQRKQKRIKIFLSFVMIITIIVILIGFSLKSDFFNINRISIKGNSNITKEKLLHTSSIIKGENIFRIRIKDAEKNILQLPYTKSVEVKRKLPKGIDIEVVEREEKLLIKNISMYYVIDEEGFVLNQFDSNNKNLPVVLGLKTDKISIGDNLFVNLDLKEFEDFIVEGEKLDLLSKIYRINIDDNENVNIMINSGIDVAFGALDNVKYKVRLLNEILVHSQDNDILISKIIMDRGEHPIIVVDD